jgi:3-carboxy-cis,cis-muconate cycloisomerase
MIQNLHRTDGQIAAEAVMMRLGEQIGRQKAHDLVYEACELSIEEGRSLYSILATEPEISLVISQDELRNLLEPTNYVGLAPFFVDQVIGHQNDNLPTASD